MAEFSEAEKRRNFKRSYRQTRPKKARRKEVAGPYRDQSSVPEIRSQATDYEHRTVATEPATRNPAGRTQARKRKARRIRSAERKLDRIQDRATEILNDSDLPDLDDSPQFWLQKARTEGRFPPEDLKRSHPRSYRKAEDAAHAFLDGRENLKEDPLAEFAISTIATAGLGAAAGGAGKLLGAGAKAVAGGEAATATKAAKTVEKGIAARTASGAKRARTAPRKSARKLKEAPKKAKRATSTKEGREALRRAESGRLSAAGKRARRKPVRYTGAGWAAAPPLGVNSDVGDRANALVGGTAEAIYDNPIGTAKATARGVVGAVAGPLALGGAAVDSALTGSPAPLRNTATEQIEGSLELGKRLLSGDQEAVQETIENDTGLTPYASLLALPRLKTFKKGKRILRDKAQTARRTVAEKTGSERIRVAPDDVDSHVIAPIERRNIRKRVARRVSQETNGPRVEAGHFQDKILNSLKKAPVARSLRNRHGMEAGDLIQAFAEYGIRTAEDVKFVREHGPVGEGGDGVNLRTALDFAAENPKILTDKHFKAALAAYIESTEALPAAKAGKGRRAKAMAQGDMLGVRRPEDRVPFAAREFTKAKTRTGAWQQAAKREKAIERDRRKGRDLAAQAQVAKGAERERLKAEASTFYRAARKAEERNAKLVKALGKFTHPGQALSSRARRKFYDEQLLREYEAEVDAARATAALAEPAWTRHSKQREPGEVAPGYPTAAGGVEHIRSGKLSAEDRVDRSLRALLSGSVVGPRLRAGGQALARRFTTEEMLPVRVDGKTKTLITADEWSRAVKEGQYSSRHHVLFPARQFKQAMLDPFRNQAELATIAGTALEKGLRTDSPHTKYVVVRREAAKEFAAQISPAHWAGEQLVNKVSQGASRWLLFSPAWVMIQSVAEAVPMALAHPELLNPVKVAQLERRLHQNQKLNLPEAKAFAATAGEAPTSLHTPNAMRPELTSNPHGVFSDGARALTRTKVGQAAFSVARLRTFGLLDNWRQGQYRRLLLAAEADRQLNSWWAGMKGALHIQKRISDELRQLPKNEQLGALTRPKYKKDLDEMQRHIEAISGNWQAFTRYERTVAPFLVFYPFLRYSLRWPLTFAKQHPVSATVTTFLGQQNAEQLDKILGHAPANPLAYALPVWQDGEGKDRILAEGGRAGPGLSAPTQAIVSGKPSQTLSAFNPAIGAALTGLTGINAYTGEQQPEKGKQAADLLLATSPALRYFDIDSSDLTGLLGFDTTDSPSIAGQVFDQLDQGRKDRKLIAPWGSVDADSFRKSENFSGDLGLKYSDPIPELSDNPEIMAAIYGTEGKGGWVRGEKGPLHRLLREHKLSEKGGDRVKKREEPFFTDEDLTPTQEERASEAYRLLNNGYISFKPEPSKSDRLRKQLGIDPSPSTDDLRRKLGIPEASEADELKRKLGIR